MVRVPGGAILGGVYSHLGAFLAPFWATRPTNIVLLGVQAIPFLQAQHVFFQRFARYTVYLNSESEILVFVSEGFQYWNSNKHDSRNIPL